MVLSSSDNNEIAKKVSFTFPRTVFTVNILTSVIENTRKLVKLQKVPGYFYNLQ